MMQPEIVSQLRSCREFKVHAAFDCIFWTVAASVHAAPGAHTSYFTSALRQISHASHQDLHASRRSAQYRSGRF